jgi:putative flippase GtrA
MPAVRLMKIGPELTRILRFGLVGGVAFVTYAGVMEVAVNHFGTNQVIGAFAGFVVGTIFSYIGNSLFSFRVRPTASNSMKFWIVTLVGLGLNLAIAFLFGRLGAPPLLTALTIFTAVPALNYLGHRFWSFRDSISATWNSQ